MEVTNEVKKLCQYTLLQMQVKFTVVNVFLYTFATIIQFIMLRRCSDAHEL